MTRRLTVLVVASALAAGCGGQHPKAQTPSAGGPGVVDAPGRLVAIGGGRTLYLYCVGHGSPAVVLDAGFGTSAIEWRDVQPQLGRITRTCSYDRAGSGNSIGVPGIRNATDEVDDLRRLLASAHIEAPYVLAGHSYGGVVAREFAREHRSDTAGLVLVDTMGRDGRARQLAIWPRSQARAIRRGLATSTMDGIDLAAGEAQASRLGPLGDLPLAVVTAGRETHFPRRPARLGRDLRRLWLRMQDELAGLSDNSVHAVALRSTHDIPLVHGGQPEVVVRAVDAVVRAVRAAGPIGPCTRVFGSLPVSCRG